MEKSDNRPGYFLRAYYYHMLYSVYGRIPLIDHTYDLDSEFKEERADMDDVADLLLLIVIKLLNYFPQSIKMQVILGVQPKGRPLL